MNLNEIYKKNKSVVWIVLVIAAVLLISKYAQDNQPLNEPGDMLVINLYDANGNRIVERSIGPQSTVGTTPGVVSINFDTIIQNTGNVPLKTLRISTSAPSQLTSAYSAATTLATLATGGSHTWSSALIPVAQFEGQTVTFSVGVTGSYNAADGTPGTITRSGTKTVTVKPDVCSDNTPWSTCSTSKPKYCNAGTLIDKASVCGCPTGYEINPTAPETCRQKACSDGTLINTCTSNKPDYCNDQKVIVKDCLQCSCPTDYYGNPMTCQAAGTCVAQSYTPNFVVTVGYE